MPDDPATPGTAVERALVSDRLARLDAGLERLGGEMRDGNGLLRQLVEQGEARARREEHAAKIELEERTARGKWLRSLLSRDVVAPLVAGLVGALAGAAGMHGATPSQSHAQQAESPHPPALFEP